MNKFVFSKKNRTLMLSIFVGLIISIVTLSVVYAALSTALTISGSTDVVASSWNVYLANGSFTTTIPSVSSGTNPKPVSSVYSDYKVFFLATTGTGSCNSDCINYMSGTNGSFTTTPIEKPGDFKAISFDVVNDGTIDAKLDGFTLSGISSDQDVYLNYYILYSDGTTPKSGDVLSAGSFDSMVLVIEFDKNVTADQLPTTNQNLDLSFTLNYVQN